MRRPGEGLITTYGAYAGDLDQDGSPDLSLPNERADDVRVMTNDGCGNFTLTPANHSLAPGSTPSTNEGQDFDGDGVTDLAVGQINGQSMSVLMGDGVGGYRPAVRYASGSGTRGLAVLDVEGDGDVDVVTANRVSSDLALHRNAGDGTFLAATFFDGGGSGETGVAAGDADNDGVFDLFVANHGSGTVTLLLGDGAGGFAVSATRAVDGEPWMIAVGDVDGDGNLDAATCNSSRPSASVLRGDGRGGLLPAVSYATGTFPIAVDLGDLDGDGDLDLVVSNLGSASFTVLFNDGTGVFGAPATLASSSAGSCALIVDYDRDGDSDIVGIDEHDDLVLLFEQAGPSPPQVQPPTCDAALRIDSLANRGGFGGASPHEVAVAGSFFAGVSAGPGLTYALAIGGPLEPGARTSLGILNLALAPIVFLPPRVTSAQGEGLQSVAVPAGPGPGVSVALQGVVVDPSLPPGAALTNPERIVLR